MVAALQQTFLFKECDRPWLLQHLLPESLMAEKLYSNRPVFTAFRPGASLNFLYVVVAGGPVITRSAPLDRVIALTYPGSCFGMRNLTVGCGPVMRAFPSLVEAYKTTDVIKVPVAAVQALYETSEPLRQRYRLLFELREKFQYHLLNCSTYPPQAVAALLRSLIYQERSLGNQPQPDGLYRFDLPVDLIARACQLNHRTVEQVLKGMLKVGLLQPPDEAETAGDWVVIADPEGLKEVYGATRDKVSWWPLR
ncbi:MAG: Crp/Fnr family transcriptional regulator [Leptolyngbya sp. SIO4C5]|nr:Crp/Fnr family transcriptional regulator [Leptolyngbya sp. SIO4C5]